MKHTILKLSIFSAIFGLVGCMSGTNSVSGVEDNTQNTKTLWKVQGVAATGYALVDAEIVVVDADEEELYTGTTDAEGNYEAQWEAEEVNEPIAIRVRSGEWTLEALLLEVGASATAIAHVNPITDLIAKGVRASVQAEGRGLKDADKTQLREQMRAKAKSILGEEFDYEDFSQKPDFVAAIRGRSDVIPSVEDMVIHALTESARNDSVSLEAWIAARVQAGKPAVLKDEAFQARLVVLAEDHKVDAQEFKNRLGEEAATMRSRYAQQASDLDLCARLALAPIMQAILELEVQAKVQSENAEISAKIEDLKLHMEAVKAEIQTKCSNNDADSDEVVVPVLPLSEEEYAQRREQAGSQAKNPQE
jgi:hypothetical protein